MEVEQWYISVDLKEGEGKRQELKELGLLDNSLRPRTHGNQLLIPVCREAKGAERGYFHQLLQRIDLPRHEMVGGIAILQEYDKEDAEMILRSRPSTHTVLVPEGAVEGEFRTRRFRVAAGVPTTSTRCTEYGIRLDVDLSVAYFSPRLANERNRVVSMAESGEVVLDMFAGVGPFALALSKKASVVWASDLNPSAVSLMIKNIRMNRIRNIIPLIADAGRLHRIIRTGTFDRIIMNLPMDPLPFLKGAFELCRGGGTIHMYALQEREGGMLPHIRKFPYESICEHEVRSYSPAMHHAVYDITVKD